MFNTWETWHGLGALIPATASIAGGAVVAGERRFSPLDDMVFSISGAPDTGVLLEIKKNGQILKAASWEGKRTDAAGNLTWGMSAPSAAGVYSYRFIIPINGETVDPDATVTFRVGAPVAVDDSEFITNQGQAGSNTGGTGSDSAVIEEGGGLQIPQTITLFGVQMSPLMLGALAVGAFFIFKGKR